MTDPIRKLFCSFASGSIAFWFTGSIAVLIGVFTLIPITGTEDASGIDKVVHAIAFAGLILPVALAQPQTLRWLIPLAILYGGAIEIVQPYFGRGREGLDFVADIAGVGIGVAVGLTLRHKFVSETELAGAEDARD